MQIDDFFTCPDGAILKLLAIDEHDRCIFKDIELNLEIPIDRAVAEARLTNVSEQADEQWRGLNDAIGEVMAA